MQQNSCNQFLSRIHAIIKRSIQHLRSGEIRCEADWSAWMARAICAQQELRDNRVVPIEEFRVNFRDTHRACNLHADLGIWQEGPAEQNGLNGRPLALIEVKMARFGKSTWTQAQTKNLAEKDLQRLQSEGEMSLTSGDDRPALIALAWSGRAEHEIIVMSADPLPDPDADLDPMVAGMHPWSESEILRIVADWLERRATAPFAATMHNLASGNTFRPISSEATAVGLLGRRIMEYFADVQVLREVRIPESRGFIDLVVTDAKDPNQWLAIIECKGLLIWRKPRHYPNGLAYPSQQDYARQTLSDLGIAYAGAAQRQHAQFPKLNGRNVVNDHICEDLIEIIKERERMLRLIRDHHNKAIAICDYTLSPNWRTDPEDDLQMEHYLKDLLSFCSAVLVPKNRNNTDRWHIVCSGSIRRHIDEDAAIVGRLAQDVAAVICMVDGEYVPTQRAIVSPQ